MSKMDQLRAMYSPTKDKQGGENRGNFVNKYYPFWDMKAGQRAVIRFLPDKDATNPRLFTVEKLSHNLTINGNKRTVPCLAMYDEPCPVCKVSQDYYKVNDKINGKKYWRKKQIIAQALVIEDPLPANDETGETHQGQVRHIALGFQLHEIIKEAFASVDEPLLEAPHEFVGGYDFIIKKTEQGEYATYAMGSKFMGRQRDLTDEEVAVAEADMIELKTLLPKHPGLEKVQAMLNADLNGEDYKDPGKDEGSAPRAPAAKPAAPKPAAARSDEDDEPPFEPTPRKPAPAAAAPAGEDDDVDAMLAAIQARRKAAAGK